MVNCMKLPQMMHLSLLEMSRWLSELLMPKRHFQEGASTVTRSDIISEMRNERFFKLKRGTCKGQLEPTGPQSKEGTQTNWDQCEPIGDACFNPNTSNPEGRNGEMGEEEVMT